MRKRLNVLCMNKSLQNSADKHKICFHLSPKKMKELLCSPCSFCHINTVSSKRTYQNAGLHHWKKGFIDENVFPLCKLCYKMRNGNNLKEMMNNICCILFRKQVRQKMQYPKQLNNTRCVYCYSIQNLSKNKIDPTKNYTKNNIQTLCWTCNRMKSNIKETTFFKHLRRLCMVNYSLLKLSISKGCSSSFSKKDSS